MVEVRTGNQAVCKSEGGGGGVSVTRACLSATQAVAPTCINKCVGIEMKGNTVVWRVRLVLTKEMTDFLKRRAPIEARFLGIQNNKLHNDDCDACFHQGSCNAMMVYIHNTEKSEVALISLYVT